MSPLYADNPDDTQWRMRAGTRDPGSMRTGLPPQRPGRRTRQLQGENVTWLLLGFRLH